MCVDEFFKYISGQKVDIAHNISQDLKHRLERYDFVYNVIDCNKVIDSRRSKTLIIDFRHKVYDKIFEKLKGLSKLYKKIVILNFKIDYAEAPLYYEILSDLTKNFMIEAADTNSYNIINACGQYTTFSHVPNRDNHGSPIIDNDLTGKVSVICACMNRNDILKINIMSWLNFSEIGEIVIVDWSSERSLHDLIYLDSRIKVICVPNQKYFNISQAFNLALDHSSLEYIIKLDCDYFLNPYYNFFKNHPIRKDSFYSGSWSAPINSCDVRPLFQHLSGLCYARREAMLAINGYNEHFNGYGYDDTDCHNRLILSGLQCLIIHYDYSIMHIPHDHSHRTINYHSNIAWSDKTNKDISRCFDLAPPRVKNWRIVSSMIDRLYYAYEDRIDL